MIVTFTFLIITNFCFPQVSGLALYGIGDKVGKEDVSSIGLGNCTFFSGNLYGITVSSPSSIWKSALTRFTMHSGMNYLSTSSFPKQFQHNLTHFSIFFPIGNQRVFGFGLKPLLRTNSLEIETDFQYIGANESSTYLPIAYKTSYYIDGGISKIFLQYSFNTNSNFSFGVQYSLLFGTQAIDEKRYTYDIVIDSTISGETVIGEFTDDDIIYYIYEGNGEVSYMQDSHQFSGSEIILEGRYSVENHEYVFRTAINGNIDIETAKGQNTDDRVYFHNFKNTTATQISELALGYHNKISSHSGMIMEYQINYPINLPKEVILFNTDSPYENSIHIGTYYQLKNPKYGFWNNLNIRGGSYLKQFDFSGDKYIDYGFTFGLGLEYLSNTQTLDIAIRAGKRESYILPNQEENYISFHFGITTGEKWFMK